MALGAPGIAVLQLVMGQSTALTLAGVVLGLGAAALLTKYLQGLLFDLTPLDVTTFAAVPVLFIAIAAIASYVPARRATKVDPQIVLRCE
jgi:ABC-type antimicrobial peptide transport system permease subunit